MGRPLCVASISSRLRGVRRLRGSRCPPVRRVARARAALPARARPARVPARVPAPPARPCHVSRAIGCFGAPALTGGAVLSGDRPDWVLPRVEMLGRGRFDHPRGTSTHNKRARRTCKRLICSTTRDRPVSGTSKVIPNRMGEPTNPPPRLRGRTAPPPRPHRTAARDRPAAPPRTAAAPPCRPRPSRRQCRLSRAPRPAPRSPRCVIIERLNREPEPRRQHDHHLR